MRTLILALLLMLGTAYAEDATPVAPDPVQLPAQDFQEIAPFFAKLTNGRLLDDGRQIVLLDNGMAFVSYGDNHIGAVRLGCQARVTNIFGLTDGRHTYRITCGAGKSETHMNGIRFQ